MTKITEIYSVVQKQKTTTPRKITQTSGISYDCVMKSLKELQVLGLVNIYEIERNKNKLFFVTIKERGTNVA